MTKTIEQAAKECREAWENNPSEYGWCIHHEVEMEKLIEPIHNRINYIIDFKDPKEIVIRLDNLRPVLSPSVILAYKAYNEAKAMARKAYNEALKDYEEAKDLAWKAYEEATAPAWKVYNKALKDYEEAKDLALKAYNEATAAAWKAYNEAKAMAWKVYNEAITPALEIFKEAAALAHAKDVPGHTWNGKSIF